MNCEDMWRFENFKIGGLWNFSVQKLVVGWSNLFLIVYLNAYSSLTRLQPEFDHIRSISNSQCCQNQPPLVWCGHSFSNQTTLSWSLAISWMSVFRIYVFKTQQPSNWLVISIHMINYIPQSLQIYQKKTTEPHRLRLRSSFIIFFCAQKNSWTNSEPSPDQPLNDA